MECEFCGNEIKNPYFEVCPECKFPLHGSDEAKGKFKNDNEELAKLVNEAESALSWARFGMLWPFLTTIIIGGCFFLRAPTNIYAMTSDCLISSLFIFCHFRSAKNPIPSLTMAFVLLLMIMLYAIYQMGVFILTLNFLVPFIIPAILLIMYGNALYLQTKLKKELIRKKDSTI